MLTAFDAHAWLRKRQFDVVHFPELHGHGYYCVLAKHQGLDFNHTVLCIGTHSPISWIPEQNKEAPYSPERNSKWISWSANLWRWPTSS